MKNSSVDNTLKASIALEKLVKDNAKLLKLYSRKIYFMCFHKSLKLKKN